jgi:HSP90 family molecular chaperone
MKIAEENADKFQEIQKTYGSIFKLGAVEDLKNREKLGSLIRFTTTHRNSTSFNDVCLLSLIRLARDKYDCLSSISKTRRKARNRYMIHLISLAFLRLFADFLPCRDGQKG